MEKNTKTILIVSGAVAVLYLLLRNRKDTTLIIEKQGETVFVPTPSVSTQPASTSVTTSGSTTGSGTGASVSQNSGGLTTDNLIKNTTTTTGAGSSTGVSVGAGKQDQSSASIPSGGITGVDTPTGGGQVQDYARPMTGTAGGNVVVAFDGFMYSSNGKKLTLNDLIRN
jgi:hypothetical protein